MTLACWERIWWVFRSVHAIRKGRYGKDKWHLQLVRTDSTANGSRISWKLCCAVLSTGIGNPLRDLLMLKQTVVFPPVSLREVLFYSDKYIHVHQRQIQRCSSKQMLPVQARALHLLWAERNEWMISFCCLVCVDIYWPMRNRKFFVEKLFCSLCWLRCLRPVCSKHLRKCSTAQVFKLPLIETNKVRHHHDCNTIRNKRWIFSFIFEDRGKFPAVISCCLLLPVQTQSFAHGQVYNFWHRKRLWLFSQLFQCLFLCVRFALFAERTWSTAWKLRFFSKVCLTWVFLLMCLVLLSIIVIWLIWYVHAQMTCSSVGIITNQSNMGRWPSWNYRLCFLQ